MGIKNKISRISKSWWFWGLVLGAAVRLLLMPLTLHPDLWGHSAVAYFFSHQGIVNIYEHLLLLPQSHPLVENWGVGDIFIYPPLTYFTLGFFRLLIKPFEDPGFVPLIMQGAGEAFKSSLLHLHLFLYKLPYLFVDLALGFLVAALFVEGRKKRAAFWLWMLNPVSLYATFMIGQMDVLPVFFTVLALVLVGRGRNSLALISLGVGASFKMYPLFFVIPAAVILGRTFGQKVKYALLGLAPFVVSIAPFVPSAAFRQMVLFGPKSQKMLFMGLGVSGAEFIYPFVALLAFLYFRAYFEEKKEMLIVYILGVALLIFSVTHYHPQWFLWATPFLVWELVRNNFRHWVVVLTLFACWLGTTLFFEPSLSLGLFAPVRIELANAVGLSEVVGGYYDVFQLKSLLRSVFAGASLFLVYALFKKPSLK